MPSDKKVRHGRFDILIKGGTLLDGSGRAPYRADIGVSGERITLIGEEGSFEAEKTIDASGLFVSPGFIDVHSHSEFTLLADPRAEGKAAQGVTTEINGNCGLSGGPLLGEALRQRQADIRESGAKKEWSTLGEYLRMLEGEGIALNFATLAGHGNIRASVVGYGDRPPTGDEMARMKALLSDSLEEGAIGLSTGLIYPPGMWAETGELIGLCEFGVSSGLPFIYASHMRSEGEGLFEAIDEVVRIAGESGAKAHISHIKTSGRENWHKADIAIKKMEEAREKGISLTSDRYPYTAGSTDLDSILPKWAIEGGNDAVLKRLLDGEIRRKIKEEIEERYPDRGRWRTVVVADVFTAENKWMEGVSLEDIAGRLGLSPVEALIKILLDEKLRAGGIFHSMSEENLRKFLKLPYGMIGSDSSARSSSGPTRRGKPHPRGFGSFARFLGKYVREEGLMGMPEAVRKITSLPAATFGLKHRGLLAAGYFADIVMFKGDEIIDRAEFGEPFNLSEGIRHVFINGVAVFEGGGLTGNRPGRILRNGGIE